MSIINRGTLKLLLSGGLGALLLVMATVADGSGALAHARSFAQATLNQWEAPPSVHLSHAPSGEVTLKWMPQNKQLAVTIEMTGLAPNSTHPAHIHVGSCNENGAILYMLRNVVANSGGNAIVTTMISNVQRGIPARGWSINVHNGPGLSPAEQFIPIACGNVVNPCGCLHHMQTIQVKLGATIGPNQSARGHAYLTLKNNILTVVVTVEGLVPGSVHAEHIHAGSCQNQVPGRVLYMLKNLVGNARGDATATTVISGVRSIPGRGWYINVHRTTDLSTQTGFDPIACGNVN